jgi:predicted nucleotidyltransferase
MAPGKNVIERVQEFTTQLLASGIPLDRVILFGSQANGTANENSDVDVALVSSIFSGFGFEDRKHFSKINIQKPFVEIETRTYSTAYFEKGDPFISEILRSGIEVYRAK